MTARVCPECGADFEQTRHWQDYCSTPCRRIANNRETARGRKLLPLIVRYARDHDDEALQAAVLMCRKWQREDTDRILRRGTTA